MNGRTEHEHLSLAAYLKRELERMADGPTMAELVERAARRDAGVPREAIITAVREARDELDD
jgi:hypothetical protein